MAMKGGENDKLRGSAVEMALTTSDFASIRFSRLAQHTMHHLCDRADGAGACVRERIHRVPLGR